MPTVSTNKISLATPFSACDDLILQFREGKIWCYVVKLLLPPWTGYFAFPGSMMKMEETLEDTMKRTYEDVGPQEAPKYAEQLYTFSSLKRDSRSRSISTAYMVPISPETTMNIQNHYKYEYGEWRELKAPGKLAFDHNDMASLCLERIAEKLLLTTLSLFLLPKEFTLTEMQNLYEYSLEKKLDKRNFRKKILSLGIIEETNKLKTGLRSRPAMLYRATHLEMKKISFMNE